MRSIRHVIGTLAVVTALGSGLTACGPEEDKAADTSAGASATAKPSQAGKGDKGAKGDGKHDDQEGELDCGKPPTLPAGIKMIQVGLHRDASVIETFEAKPKCTPNDWIYHGDESQTPKAYKLPANVKGELAMGPGKHKQVNRDELSKHIDGCLRNDYNVVKEPFSCHGNVYEITLNAKGDEVKTMRERWSV
ncbi:hypothetical protein [Streptomyces griseocarneus]|uniref:hypothetical protein n=1 Tax=Streptomyces griseocarneus TaxID=51201 RepID=UPI00167CA064|nr:hypothetical protein [Streptomyces griseocarneus]MBZ6476577.1 hypothetical protein [Streptomyces griseocarneus]GHG79628.1 hypothetical protein GCM10018779_60520 [Streptomyces griseocarneus]